MKTTVAFLFLLATSVFTCRANSAEPDTIFAATENKPLVKPIFNFDARYTLIDRKLVLLNGIKFGLEWKEKVRTGLGIYLLSTPFYKEIGPFPETNGSVTGRLRFGYVAGYTEYVLYRSEKWEFSTPLQFGAGPLYYDYKNAAGHSRRTDRQTIYLVEPSITGHYKFFYWLGIGAGAGYRQILNQPTQLNNDLDAPVFYIRGKLFLGELYKGLRQNQEKRKAAG
jgi:hypothetical protein